MIALLSIVSVSFGNDTNIGHQSKIDTLKKISLMFTISHGELNSFDIKNHPTFKLSPETYIYSTTTELKDGLSLSEDGLITWSPSLAQFEDLKEQPIVMNFYAHSLSSNIVFGEIRIVGEGGPAKPPKEDAISPNPQEDMGNSSPAALQSEPLTIQLPKSKNWDTKKEGETFAFEIGVTGGSGNYKFELLEPAYLMEFLDKYGMFSWSPDFDIATSENIVKSIRLKIKVFDTEGNEAFKTLPIYVEHVNRPPVVNELPTFYVHFDSRNIYYLNKQGLIYDPDGDSIIFNPVLKELPQHMTLNSKGEIYWQPSRRQFNYLRANPIYLSFTVEDFPGGTKSIGQVKIEVSQVDLPPQITMIPNREAFEIKENEELNLSFFLTDPNGEEDLLSFGFLSENREIDDEALTEKTKWQYSFSWTPGYNFITEEGGKSEFGIHFFAIDKESNRTERSIVVTVEDTENLVEKDRILYDQYRTVLERAWDLISQLNEKEEELEKKYKSAKRGKKNRAISTASLGALTGLSPIVFIDNPDGQKVAAGLGGTATATIGTLEASNVIGEPPSDIMRDLNYVSQKRNDLIVHGNIFAGKYALPLSKRDRGFQNDLRSMSMHLSLQDVAKLDLSASWENPKKGTGKNIKKAFKDFNKDPRFEASYD